MKIIIKENYSKLSKFVANKILQLYKNKNNFVLGLTTGETPKGLYSELSNLHKNSLIDFYNSKIFILDEYIGISKEHPYSHYQYLNNNLFKNINIQKNNIFCPDGINENLHEECLRYENLIDENGIDIQILGVDKNGTISFNSPSSKSELHTHIEDLIKEKIDEGKYFFENEEDIPTTAISMGIGSIFKAKELILLANGENKAKIMHTLKDNIITPLIPVSILKLHPNLTIVMDKDAARYY